MTKNNTFPQFSSFPSLISGQRIRRVLLRVALLLATACTAPEPNDREKGGDATPDAPTAKELTSLVFLASNNPGLAADVTALIDGTSAKATVPFGRNQSLVATFATTGARVEVAGVPQESGVTGNAFESPVVYHVIAGDGSTQDYTVTVATPVQQAYVKAFNPGESDSFGYRVAVSADGNTLAVGATDESSNATGIDGKDNDAAPRSGAVYVFTRSGAGWSQQAYIKASNAGANDLFGYSVALSADGNTLAVGALGESSNATGVDGQDNDAVPWSGAVYVFTRSGTAWSQQAYVKASTPGMNDFFGYSVALSPDGNTLAVGANGESSNTKGIDGSPDNDDAPQSGAVYVFTRSGAAWSRQAYIKASNTGPYDFFGASVALSADGNTLAVGAAFESSNATGIDGQDNDAAPQSGAVYVFARSGTAWSQQAYVKASNTGANETFGYSVALSADGDTLAVGAKFEASNSRGINGRQDNDSAIQSGAVYLFSWSGAAWSQHAYIKASNTGKDDSFGGSVALSADGNTLAVGAGFESSSATGIDGQDNDAASQSGAVYVFSRSDTAWSQQAYVKASNTGKDDSFGANVALSADGVTLAVAATGEASAAMDVNDNNKQSDNSKPGSGAVYVFH